MNCDEVIQKIQNSRRFSDLPGVEMTGQMLEYFGSPEKQLKFIHVAGTNGKGSTCAFLAQILQEAGYRTGLFTSPYLVHFQERIRVNGEEITEEALGRLGEQVFSFPGGQPGMFDYSTVIGILYFLEEHCDVVVLETGLGGRLDCTNAVGIPEAVVLTPVGFDHMQVLGNTLAEIAAEKAGIIKPGTTVVMHPQEAEAFEVLEAACRDRGVPYRVAVLPEEVPGQEFALEAASGGERIKHLGISLLGTYQYGNAATAVETVRVLREKGYDITDGQIRAALKATKWAGRMEPVWENPVILLDGAHNIHGVTALRKSLDVMYPGRKLLLLAGVLADKDYEEMIREMEPLAKEFYTVTPDSARALQGRELADFIQAQGYPARNFESVQEAADYILSVDREEVVCVFGSLYFIGEMEQYFSEKKKSGLLMEKVSEKNEVRA